MENNSRFKVIFKGELQPGYTVEQVKQNIATLYNIPVEKFNRWFTGDTIKIKDNVDYATANKYKQALDKAGAICVIETIEKDEVQIAKRTDNHNLPTPKMTCPKCGFEQSQTEECRKCQIVIKKYLEYKKQVDAITQLTSNQQKYSKELPKYEQCKCGFWIASIDLYCPNCGIHLKNKTINFISRFFLITFLLQGMVVLGTAGFLSSGLKEGFGGGIIGAIIGGIVGLLISAVIKGENKRVKWSITLINEEKKIRAVWNVADFKQKIGSGLKKFYQAYEDSQDIISWIVDIQRRQEFYQQMDDMIDEATLKQYQLGIQLWELQLVRWQNYLIALFSNWVKSTEETYKNCLETIEQLIQSFDVTLHEWMQTGAANIPEGTQCIIRLHEVSDLTKQIYQRLAKESSIDPSLMLADKAPFKILPDVEEFYAHIGIPPRKSKRKSLLGVKLSIILASILWLFSLIVTVATLLGLVIQ